MSEYFAMLAWGSEGWGDELFDGMKVTVLLALATLPFGLVLGFLVALARNSKAPELVTAANIFTTIFRGLPELLTLFIVYYGGQILLQQFIALFTDTYVEVNKFVAGMIALGLVFSAFASEVFLAALRAISRGQIEAAMALGLNRWLAMRLVTIPQLIRYALPGMSNLWLVLLKDTSLVSIIALPDLVRMTNVAVGGTKEPFFFYSIASLLYLSLALLSSVALTAIERRVNRGYERA